MIGKRLFGTTEDGRPVYAINLDNENDLFCTILTYGARIQRLVFQDTDVVLGYDTLQEYEKDRNTYFGATVGRFANRIENGRFSLSGKTYPLYLNENGITHLHGGKDGFDRKNWEITELEDSKNGHEPYVTLHYRAEDGEEGYPGAIDVWVTFSMIEDNGLCIHYKAIPEKDTVLNLTNHSYFNLDGSDSCLDTELSISADRILFVDHHLIPTQICSLDDAPCFDFRLAKKIGQDIDAPHPQLQTAGGYDHAYILDTGYRLLATAKGANGIKMSVYTDMPSIQFYSGNFLDGTIGKNRRPMNKHAAFCLETQMYPNSPNRPDFPSCEVKAGKVWRSGTEYVFDRAGWQFYS